MLLEQRMADAVREVAGEEAVLEGDDTSERSEVVLVHHPGAPAADAAATVVALAYLRFGIADSLVMRTFLLALVDLPREWLLERHRVIAGGDERAERSLPGRAG